MALIEATTTSDGVRSIAAAERDVGFRVVWLRGDYDIATVAAMAATLSREIALDDADLVLEMSAVTFMDASTVTVIVRTSSYLQARARSLRLRSPSSCARLVLDVCELDVLLEVTPDDAAAATAHTGALATWVAVPPTEPGHVVAGQPTLNG